MTPTVTPVRDETPQTTRPPVSLADLRAARIMRAAYDAVTRAEGLTPRAAQ